MFEFRVLRWTSFVMIPLTFLNDECIDRSKSSERKNPIEYIVAPSPHKWGRNNNFYASIKLRVTVLDLQNL